ncbi:hypothetical protein AVEN_97882-1 [Araneus ventricosus]|uniref:Uncharacterized protein n=1 Tax=Araneus ventricosus TaxID=182803 RepID=A0A4Y2F2B2_ARAVE|nr:hypothetical protein AVEN_97882-1 [Araneus ventricosus]
MNNKSKHLVLQIAILVCSKGVEILGVYSGTPGWVGLVNNGIQPYSQPNRGYQKRPLDPQICELAARLTRQECKLETSLQHANANELDVTRQTCHKLAVSIALQTIAKTEYKHNLGFEPPTSRFLNLSS